MALAFWKRKEAVERPQGYRGQNSLAGLYVPSIGRLLLELGAVTELPE